MSSKWPKIVCVFFFYCFTVCRDTKQTFTAKLTGHFRKVQFSNQSHEQRLNAFRRVEATCLSAKRESGGFTEDGRRKRNRPRTRVDENDVMGKKKKILSEVRGQSGWKDNRDSNKHW